MEDWDPGDEEYYWKMEDFEDHAKSLESDGKLSWIWRNGVKLGKKIVVTGVVVSSVPFVLPPLVVLSSIGFALSVPAGFVFVTYECGKKFVNTLLPLPEPHPSEQYELISNDEGVYRFYRDDNVGKVYEGYEDIEAEDEIYYQDTQKGLERGVELYEKNNEIDDYDQTLVYKDELDKRSSKMTGIVEEEGYEEDVGEYMEDEEQPLDSRAIPDILEGINEAENEIALMEKEGVGKPRDSLRAVVVEAELGGENESNVEQLTEDIAFVPPREIIQDNDYKEKLAAVELKSETTGLIEEIRDLGENDPKREDSRAEETPEENEAAARVSEKDMSQDKGLKDLDVIPEEVEPPMNDTGVINGLSSDANLDYLAFEEDESSGLICDEPIVENQLVVTVRLDGDHTVTDIHQGTCSDKIGTLMIPDEDARKLANGSGFDMSNDESRTPDLIIDSSDKMPEYTRQIADESGFDMSDEESIEPGLIVDSLNKMPEGDVVEVTVDYHEVVIESAIPVSDQAENAPAQETTAGSDKVKLAEKKVWEQINAIRIIVGYTNTPDTSYVEELKALYVFTGIEPPISSKDPADLADISEKLHFLMSIVGVK